ncbi:MAG: alanine dehydrogenase [Micrococcales bacterium]|nr:MAG: alanine dehydrogenase [Micrococcales bacterium]
MKTGVPTEVKNNEYRVSLTPAGVRELVRHGHQVFVQAGAGEGSSFHDQEYAAAGAELLGTAAEVWEQAEMIVKVKEPTAAEYPLMREGQILYTYLHLAANEALTKELQKRKVVCVAYETVRRDDGSLPLLAPMSEVAGRLAPLVGAHTLMAPEGGRGVLLGGIPGVPAGQVVILGAGVAGINAAEIALGMQAEVRLLDTNVDRLRQIDAVYRGHCHTIAANDTEIEAAVSTADLVIGAVLVAGAKAPKLISNDLVSTMRPGSVLVDVSIDQGGCFEDSRPTTHAEPTFTVHNSTFYCVANMPGAVPRTSTIGLTNVTLAGAVALADKGWRQALLDDAALSQGLNVADGAVVNQPVATAHGLEHTELGEVLGRE